MNDTERAQAHEARKTIFQQLKWMITDREIALQVARNNNREDEADEIRRFLGGADKARLQDDSPIDEDGWMQIPAWAIDYLRDATNYAIMMFEGDRDEWGHGRTEIILTQPFESRKITAKTSSWASGEEDEEETQARLRGLQAAARLQKAWNQAKIKRTYYEEEE